MKRFVMSLLGVLAIGCTHTRSLGPGFDADAAAGAMRVLKGREADVYTSSGDVFRWRDVRFTPDSVSGGVESGRISLPISELRVVTAQSKLRGLGDGILCGMLAGAGIGALLASGVLASGGSQPYDYGDWSDEPVAGVLLSTASGAFMGAFVGLLKGATFRVLVR